jgi:transcription elongation GreA/GreB family factor
MNEELVAVRAMRDQDRIDARLAAEITPDGRLLLEEHVADLRDRRLPELGAMLQERERDERTVVEFESMLLEIAEWEGFLAEAVNAQVNAQDFDGRIVLGARALVTLADGSEAWVRPVHPREAFLDDERISVTSPVGTALIGAKPGDVVSVNAPTGVWKCSVRSTELVTGKEAA